LPRQAGPSLRSAMVRSRPQPRSTRLPGHRPQSWHQPPTRHRHLPPLSRLQLRLGLLQPLTAALQPPLSRLQSTPAQPPHHHLSTPAQLRHHHLSTPAQLHQSHRQLTQWCLQFTTALRLSAPLLLTAPLSPPVPLPLAPAPPMSRHLLPIAPAPLLWPLLPRPLPQTSWCQLWALPWPVCWHSSPNFFDGNGWSAMWQSLSWPRLDSDTGGCKVWIKEWTNGHAM